MNSIVWFRNDLRVTDNSSLLNAAKDRGKVIAVYCFDPRHFTFSPFGFKKTEKYRARFLIETITELHAELAKLNITLLVYHEKPELVFPQLYKTIGFKNVYLQKEWTREEVDVLQATKESLNPEITFKEVYDQFLFHPEDIPYEQFEKIPDVFTSFRKKCEKYATVRPAQGKPGPFPEANKLQITTPIPDLETLGFKDFETDPRTAFPFRGGEFQAKRRLQQYFWETKKLSFYKHTRNGLIGRDYSSKLSPWLANGSISARSVYWEVRAYEQDVVKNRDTYWLIFELIWRDFFKYISLKYGNRIFQLDGILNKKYRWENSEKVLRKWITGNTQQPFVNANMLELLKTGWMSNRGRQNVASYWAKELEQDWRMGAAYFESQLVDYDVHSNWGNWMYNSGVGNDPRNRKFNIPLQAERYDPQGKYQRIWLQETLF